MKLDPYLISYTKFNSKWMKDLKVRPKAFKLLQKIEGKKLYDIGVGNDLLDMTSKTWATKAKKNCNYFKHMCIKEHNSEKATYRK